jgi:hypothetical protein
LCLSVHQGLFYERSVFLYLIADMQQQVLVQMVSCFFLVEEMLTAWYEPWTVICLYPEHHQVYQEDWLVRLLLPVATWYCVWTCKASGRTVGVGYCSWHLTFFKIPTCSSEFVQKTLLQALHIYVFFNFLTIILLSPIPVMGHVGDSQNMWDTQMWEPLLMLFFGGSFLCRCL